MRITSLSIAVSRTVMVAPYQPLKLEAVAACDLNEGDDIAAARAALLAEVRLGLREAYTAFHPKHAAEQPPATEEKTNA